MQARDTNDAAMIRLEAVRKSFEDNLVLDGIGLRISPGEALAKSRPSPSTAP